MRDENSSAIGTSPSSSCIHLTPFTNVSVPSDLEIVFMLTEYFRWVQGMAEDDLERWLEM